jgi:hypothetical protein
MPTTRRTRIDAEKRGLLDTLPIGHAQRPRRQELNDRDASA